jgi:DeoR/GlpR family transcriptional regulator of sugar metabolism
MLKAERQLKILEEIKKSQKVDTNKLSSQLIVSKDTIRRDLNELSKKGKIQKVHGGAMPSAEKNIHFYETFIENEDKKHTIASKASTLLKDNQVIIISGGTTNLIFAKSIPKNLNLTVYTYSLLIAIQLAQHPNIDLIFIGGKMQKNALVTIGMDVIQFLSNIKADLCFLGTSSINEEFGLTETGYEVSIVKKAMIQSSEKVITMVTSEKINTKMPHAICDLIQIYAMITDLKPKDSKLEPYVKAGILVL